MLYRYHSCSCSLVSNALWWLECSHSYAFGTSLFKVQRVPFKRGCGHLNSCYNESIPKWLYSEWPEIGIRVTYKIEQSVNREDNDLYRIEVLEEIILVFGLIFSESVYFITFLLPIRKHILGVKKCRELKLGNCRVQDPCACRSLEFHFRPTSGPLMVHFWTTWTP